MRVFVTGLGMVTALAADAKGTFKAVLAGERSQRELQLFDLPGSRSSLACEATHALASATVSSCSSRSDRLACLAAQEALAQAKIQHGLPVGLVVGGTTAGMFETELLLAEAYRADENPASWRSRPEFFTHPLSAVAASLGANVHDFTQTTTVCSACSSGATALKVALSMLQNGRAQRVLAGGSDGLCRLTFAGFNALAAMDPEPCRPFDASRAGLNLGEGAAFLLLETEDSAQARGVEPLAELRAVAMASEAYHLTQPEPAGTTAAAVMRSALDVGSVPPSEVGYLNCHGTGTKRNDAMEATAIHACFEGALKGLRVSSTKGQHGHTLGAAGAVEAAITVLALAGGHLPPNAGLQQPLAEPSLPLIEKAEERRVEAAMSNNFGFGGTDATVLFAQPRRYPPLSCLQRTVYVHGSFSCGALGALCNQEHGRYLATADTSASTSALELGLDARRSRRMRRAAQLSAAAGVEAMAAWDELPAKVGAVIGSAFGAVEGCAEFVGRFCSKGVRFASPAMFPVLLPSSAVAQAAIYLGLKGPVFSTHALELSGLHAVVTAAELIQAGQTDAMLAGAVEEKSALAEQLFGAAGDVVRGEGCALLSLSSKAHGAAACLQHWGTPKQTQQELPPPRSAKRAACMNVGDGDHAPGSWEQVVQLQLGSHVGGHEARSSFALAVAVGVIQAGHFDQVLVLARRGDGGVQVLVSVP
jgi:3-oxoacyl-[acyl-carrier-protein] synthase II